MKIQSLIAGFPGRASGGWPGARRAALIFAAAFLGSLTLVAQPNPMTPGPLQAQPNRRVLRGHVPAVTARLTPVGGLDGAKRLDLAIGLPLRNKEVLNNLLHQIYDPASPNYRRFLKPEQFAERFGPTEQDYQAVVAFAKANGLKVTKMHSNRGVLVVNGAVADIEKAFHLNLRVYQHPKEARTFYAPDAEPSLDPNVPVLDISGLDNFMPPRPANVKFTPINQVTNTTRNAGSGQFGSYLGNDFRAAYVPGVALRGAGQAVGLLEFDGYFASDIAAYENLAGLPHVPLQNVLLDGFDGTPSIFGGNVEVALDIDMTICMAPGLAKVIVYQAGPSGIPNDILNRMATDNLARQLSSSWTWTSFGGVATTDQIFRQFAAQGQSFFNASGDSDAYIAPGNLPNTPADDPYVTVVGGTTLTTTGPGGAWLFESVWNWGNEFGPRYDGIGSSGGISPTYPIPSWQQGVNMSGNGGSTTMRNIPDVALTADNIYLIADNGLHGIIGGTSAAAPMWAGFTALVNQQAAANGNSPVGFLNPAIYAIGKGSSYGFTFHDITAGDNTSFLSPSNYFAVDGYDLCTGWGTPVGVSLIFGLAGTPPRNGFLQMSVDPPSGSTLVITSAQPIYVTINDAYAVTNATVNAVITGVTNLTFLDDGQDPDLIPNDGIYSATFQAPTSTNPVTLTVTATAPGEIGVTNTIYYNLVSPPLNDDFANATKVPLAGKVYLSNNRYATMELGSGEPLHDGVVAVGESLWWNLTPADNTNIFVDTSGSGIATVLAVYTGQTLDTLQAVAATNNIGSPLASYLSFDAAAGTTYHIAVASAKSSAAGSLRVRIAPGGQPDTNSPVVFVVSPLSGSSTNNRLIRLAGTANDPQPNASGVSQVFFSVNDLPPITAMGTTNWSSLAALRQGLNTIQVSASDVWGNVSAPVNVQVLYLVLNPTNDFFAEATPLAGNSGTVSAITTNATKEVGEPEHAGNPGGKSVWWSFVPPADGVLTLSTTNSTFDTLLALYTGTNVSHLTPIASDDDAYDGAPGGFSRIIQAVRGNQTYHIAVDGYGGAAGVVKLTYSFASASVFHLTISNTPGGTVVPASMDIANGATVVLSATPDANYQFDLWDGSVVALTNPLTITVTSDMNLTAHFVPVAFTDGFESGGLQHLNWTTAGNAPWFVQTNVVAAGHYAARSGAITDNQSSSLTLSNQFLAGNGSFDFRVSSELNWDFLGFYVDGVLLQQWSGEVGWQNYVFPLTAGPHVLEWRYTKDPSLSAGLDAAFVDDVNLPLVSLELQRLSQGVVIVNLLSPTNQQVVVQVSTNLVNWQNIATNVSTSAFTHILDPASQTSRIRFYRTIIP